MRIKKLLDKRLSWQRTRTPTKASNYRFNCGREGSATFGRRRSKLAAEAAKQARLDSIAKAKRDAELAEQTRLDSLAAAREAARIERLNNKKKKFEEKSSNRLYRCSQRSG